VCPADLTAGEVSSLQEMALRAFAAVDGRGLARVDFFLTDDGPVVNELNTMPGFTPISMFPKCWIASGLSYADLISELVDTALERVVRA
jgi:D-alanine-D-alanine ligase